MLGQRRTLTVCLLHDTQVMAGPAGLNLCLSVPVSLSHILTSPSAPQTASCRPQRLNSHIEFSIADYVHHVRVESRMRNTTTRVKSLGYIPVAYFVTTMAFVCAQLAEQSPLLIIAYEHLCVKSLSLNRAYTITKNLIMHTTSEPISQSSLYFERALLSFL